MQAVTLLPNARGFAADTAFCVVDAGCREAQVSAWRIEQDRRFWHVINHTERPGSPLRRTANVMDDFGDLQRVGGWA